jgi:CheY-like chemotaxis protein
VTDTGPGVPFDRREAIFADFEQGDEALARQHGGTGLGLAISKHLVERMGGQLSLTQSSDMGSTFAISLPLPPDTVLSEPDPSMSGQRVLIASPSRFEAAYLSERLASCGAATTHVRTEVEALSFLQNSDAGAPDAVLIDCAFGEFATIALADAARQAGAKRLFVLFSPTERRELRAETLRGFDGWLVKPVRAASLFARLAPEAQPADSGPLMTSDIVQKLRGVRVLLAEDNEISRRVALKHLERHGACVTCAADGAEAVRIADANRFDVIILDVRMPVLDGLGAARRIRSSEPSTHRTPLVALTANAFPGDKRAAIDAGIDHFLAKPVDPFDLVALIQRALTGPQASDVLPRAS